MARVAAHRDEAQPLVDTDRLVAIGHAFGDVAVVERIDSPTGQRPLPTVPPSDDTAAASGSGVGVRTTTTSEPAVSSAIVPCRTKRRFRITTRSATASTSAS